MYELMKIGERTYVIDSPVKVGIYVIEDNDVCLIDTGNDDDMGRKILKILAENDWNLKVIINTHSHADHIGGNSFLQKRTGCTIYSVGVEKLFIKYPILESSMLYGAYPFSELRNKFLMAKESDVSELTRENLPKGMDFVYLDGHSSSMIALKTSDDVWFVADSVFDEDILKKYHVAYLYNVKDYFKSLDILLSLDGKLFVPSHAKVVSNVEELVEINRNKVNEIIYTIRNFCEKTVSFEDILKYIFDIYGLAMNSTQYVLVGSTVKAYLSYMFNEKMIAYEIKDNRFLWTTIL